MTAKVKKYNAQGQELDDAGNVLTDRQHIRVPMVMMDGVLVPKPEAAPPFNYSTDARPRPALVTDTERERRQKLYRDHDTKLSEAWRVGADLPE